MIIILLLSVLLVEAITNILCKSDLFIPFRELLFNSNIRLLRFIHNILDCPYCTSVWVSLFVTFMVYLYLENLLPHLLALFFISIVLHRFSNILHFIIDRLDSNHISLDKEH